MLHVESPESGGCVGVGQDGTDQILSIFRGVAGRFTLYPFSGISGLQPEFYQDQDRVIDPRRSGLWFDHGASDRSISGKRRGNVLQFPGDGFGGLFADFRQLGQRFDVIAQNGGGNARSARSGRRQRHDRDPRRDRRRDRRDHRRRGRGGPRRGRWGRT